MRWQPWDDFKPEEELLPILEPPCKDCVFWKPQRQYMMNGMYDGVRLCHSVDMQKDFSCYKERDA